jgi:DNA-damage-inducible protein J
MNAHSSMLHVRIDDDLKARATEALMAMGLTASDAVRLLFHRIAADQAFPLELKVPNAETRAAMAEAEEIVKTGKASFAHADALFADLEKTSNP